MRTKQKKLAWKLTRADLGNLWIKKNDLNAADMEGGMKIIVGTAKYGLDVEL